jgi:hypothetical protein
MIFSSVAVGENGEPVFQWNEVGSRLERRLRGTLVGEARGGKPEDAAKLLDAAYRRCWERQRCVYDYFRQRGTEPLSLDRLLLPLSRDGGQSVTDVMGLIRFSS